MPDMKNLRELFSCCTMMARNFSHLFIYKSEFLVSEFMCRHIDTKFTCLCITGYLVPTARCRAETERDGTLAETRFGFPAKRTSPFISAGVSVQSAAGSRGVRISGSNAG